MRQCQYLNARAEECLSTNSQPGDRVVQYRGAQYAVIGLYFAVLHDKHHEVFFVLRGDPDQGDARRRDHG
jgi:hypothetical protein